MGYLNSGSTLVGNLPDVVNALHYFSATELHILLTGGACHAIADEIDLARTIHGPQVVTLEIGVAQIPEGVRCNVFDPEICREASPIVFARPHCRVPGERHPLAIGGVTGGGAPIRRDGLFRSSLRAHLKERGNGGKRALRTSRREHDFRPIRAPADHRVFRTMKRQLLRLAARCWHDEHVVVACTIRRKRNPIPIR